MLGRQPEFAVPSAPVQCRSKQGDGATFDASNSSYKRRIKTEEDTGSSYHRNKRQRTSDNVEIVDRLESLILRVGEKSSSSLESNLEGLATVLEADLTTYKGKILKILTDCALKLPDKCTIYTTLIGLLNTKNYNFGGECVELLIKALRECLKTGRWEEARFGIRFISDLVNCHVISAGSLLQLLDNFVDATLEEDVPSVRRDWYAYAVLSSLPWVGRELYEKKESELDRMLGALEGYIKRRSKAHQATLRVFYSDTPHPQEEYLDNLWQQIKRLRSDMWVEKHIIRPYLAFDSVLCEALQHNLPQMIPPPHHPSTSYPLPQVVFRMFDYTDCPEGPILPGHHSIERYLIEEQLLRILCTYSYERKECAAQLLDYTLKNKIPLEYMIVEVMFGEMFALPTPKFIEICYGSILIELCKLQPSTMPQVLAQATEILYDRIDVMNVSVFDRFDWEDAIRLDKENPKAKFVSEVLYKCLRLSYHQRIKECVPDIFEKFLPPLPNPTFPYLTEEAVEGEEDIPEEEVDEMTKVQVFAVTLLHMGSKSFSHSFAAIAKFHPTLKALVSSEEGQSTTLKGVFQLWSSHQQMMVGIVDKLLKTQVVECAAIANWIFSADMKSEFTKMYVWEMLHLTIRKMNKHMIQENEDSQDEEMDGEERHKGKKRGSKKRRRNPEKGERPTEEQVEKLEEKLESAQADQKNLFLIIFQRFIMIFSEHIARCDADDVDFKTSWYTWTIGRLQQVFMLHHEQVEKYSTTLETLLFTQDVDPNILDVFQQFVALRM
ncbi:NCBP1 [Lepeophtheirus salmonis]|uniref:Nuclear cap-binding protein subunit 1 n=1 Tax=Lepeophtheirus salmonis TaxID=72036 RepID=A0A7R8CSF9_LEPSM|nr:NCBP1 [Lepeophtheirus salmonis]CAF2915677.1 NCBP1 [Lepeophtheirus salmonis]